eukprot:s2865_g7.t2
MHVHSSGVDAIVVIGGASVFAQAMEFPNCTIQMTVVSEEFDSDEFFQVGKPFWCMQEQSLGGNQVSWWRRVQPEVYDQLAYWKAVARHYEGLILQLLEDTRPFRGEFGQVDVNVSTTEEFEASSSDEHQDLQEIINRLQHENASLRHLASSQLQKHCKKHQSLALKSPNRDWRHSVQRSHMQLLVNKTKGRRRR